MLCRDAPVARQGDGRVFFALQRRKIVGPWGTPGSGQEVVDGFGGNRREDLKSVLPAAQDLPPRFANPVYDGGAQAAL